MMKTFRCALCRERFARWHRCSRTWNQYFPLTGDIDQVTADLCPDCALDYDRDPPRAQAAMSHRSRWRFWWVALALALVLALVATGFALRFFSLI